MKTLFSGGDTEKSDSCRAGSNMGIGLSVCAAIVKAHGGSIGARNRPEGGSEFFFTLKTEGTADAESV